MSKADQLGAGASFGQARPVSARRAAIGAATGAPTIGVPDPTELPVTLISHNPDNPRDAIGDVSALASTLVEIGQVQPITVASVQAYLRERPERAADLAPDAQYVVVDGHRRHAAAQQAGLTSLKVMVDDALVSSDEGLLEAAFVANAQRENMTDLEEAHALEKLVRFYGSQGKAAKRLGLTQSYISQRLSLLALSPELQADLQAGKRKVEHVRSLSSLSPDEQKTKADERAAASRDVAAQKKQKRRVAPAGDAGTPRDTVPQSHYAVMGSDTPTPTPAPATHYAVMDPHDPAPGVIPAQPTPPTASEDSVRVDTMPWHSPEQILSIASTHMTPENYKIMLKSAATQLNGI